MKTCRPSCEVLEPRRLLAAAAAVHADWPAAGMAPAGTPGLHTALQSPARPGGPINTGVTGATDFANPTDLVPTRSPFGGNPVSLAADPARVEAERFDIGGQNLTFFDADPDVNRGHSLFRSEGVDVADTNGGHVVGWTKSGEWLEYTLTAPAAVTVDASGLAATGHDGSSLRLWLDGQPVGTAAPVANHGWGSYATHALGRFDVPAGRHVLRLAFTNAGGYDTANVDYLELRHAAPAQTLQAKLDRAVAFAANQLAATAAALGPTQYPEYTNADGSWFTRDVNRWTSGFLPGQFWELGQLAARRGQSAGVWRDRARAWAAGMLNAGPQTEDVGYRDVPSLVPWVADAAAAGNGALVNQLLGRITTEVGVKQSIWNETVGAYRTSWRSSNSGNPRANYGVLLDQNYDLVLQQYALNRDPNAAAAGSPATLRDRVRRHAQTVADNLVRPDGSTAHWAYFDAATGERITRETYQGYADDSTWARGQAWAILSFSELAAGAGDASTAGYDPALRALGIATARKTADWFIAHLPGDSVPFWDFDAPGQPDIYRDSSAAAIAATGMIRLAALTGESAYRDAAGRILGSLSDGYTAAGRPERSVLVHGAANVPANVGVDGGTSYGDYYFLKAIDLWETA